MNLDRFHKYFWSCSLLHCWHLSFPFRIKADIPVLCEVLVHILHSGYCHSVFSLEAFETTLAVRVSITLSLADTTSMLSGAGVPSFAISSVVGDIKSCPFRVIAEIRVIGDESKSIKSWNCLSV